MKKAILMGLLLASPVAAQTGLSGPGAGSSGSSPSPQLPATLGPQTGANSLSVVPNVDTPFPIVGNIPSGTADSGNPVKTGGIYNSSPPVLLNGQRGDSQLDVNGGIRSFNITIRAAAIDSFSNSNVGFSGDSASTNTNNRTILSSAPFVFDGSSWNRQRGDVTGIWSGGHATINTGQVSVGTSATLIAATRTGRQKIGVTVITAVQCAFGPSGVTLSTGWPLAAVAYASDQWDTSAALYGVCASTATVAYREQY